MTTFLVWNAEEALDAFDEALDAWEEAVEVDVVDSD